MSAPTSLEHLRELLAQGVPDGHSDDAAARRQWWGALATLQDDFLLPGLERRGVWLAAPLPALYEPELLADLQGWVWTPAGLGDRLDAPPPLLSGAPCRGEGELRRLTLRSDDGTDPILLLFTPDIQLGLGLCGAAGERRLVMRSDPRVLSAALTVLDERLEQEDPAEAARLRQALRRLGAMRCDPELERRFWPALCARLAAIAPSVTLQPVVPTAAPATAADRAEPSAEAPAGGHAGGHPPDPAGADRARQAELELLEALTHEVRTPLATIRTLIRSLLRRRDLAEVVRQRLQRIDAECSEQIDRFGLIFHAAELERRPRPRSALARTDLSALLRQMEPSWTQQLERRGLGFRLSLAADLPEVLSDPSLLETTLGGLMDRFSRGLPPGQQVEMRLTPAGDRLKLQLASRRPGGAGGGAEPAPATGDTASVGPVLSWSPETGSLHLSQQATQRLFHSLGGRLTQRTGQGLIVFFPVAGSTRDPGP